MRYSPSGERSRRAFTSRVLTSSIPDLGSISTSFSSDAPCLSRSNKLRRRRVEPAERRLVDRSSRRGAFGQSHCIIECAIRIPNRETFVEHHEGLANRIYDCLGVGTRVLRSLEAALDLADIE